MAFSTVSAVGLKACRAVVPAALRVEVKVPVVRCVASLSRGYRNPRADEIGTMKSTGAAVSTVKDGWLGLHVSCAPVEDQLPKSHETSGVLPKGWEWGSRYCTYGVAPYLIKGSAAHSALVDGLKRAVTSIHPGAEQIGQISECGRPCYDDNMPKVFLQRQGDPVQDSTKELVLGESPFVSDPTKKPFESIIFTGGAQAGWNTSPGVAAKIAAPIRDYILDAQSKGGMAYVNIGGGGPLSMHLRYMFGRPERYFPGVDVTRVVVTVISNDSEQRGAYTGSAKALHKHLAGTPYQIPLRKLPGVLLGRSPIGFELSLNGLGYFAGVAVNTMTAHWAPSIQVSQETKERVRADSFKEMKQFRADCDLQGISSGRGSGGFLEVPRDKKSLDEIFRSLRENGEASYEYFSPEQTAHFLGTENPALYPWGSVLVGKGYNGSINPSEYRPACNHFIQKGGVVFQEVKDRVVSVEPGVLTCASGQVYPGLNVCAFGIYTNQVIPSVPPVTPVYGVTSNFRVPVKIDETKC